MPIIDVFDQMGGALLILGAPGAGKTTLLLELARDLIARAEQDEGQPHSSSIQPVVVGDEEATAQGVVGRGIGKTKLAYDVDSTPDTGYTIAFPTPTCCLVLNTSKHTIGPSLTEAQDDRGHHVVFCLSSFV